MTCGERCRRQALFPLLCCVLFLGLRAGGARASEPAERALWQLWRQYASTNALDHQALLTSCQAFTNQYASDPLLVVGQSMAAWNLLNLRRQPEAVAILSRHMDRTGPPLINGAALIAKSWMTRLDREQVRDALQAFYRREVRYPRSIAELLAYPKLPKDMPPLPSKDRWGTEWKYALVGFKSMPGMLDQKYEISASRLGANSVLAPALAVPYGSLVRAKPVRLLSSTPGSETVEWLIAASGGAGKPKVAEKTVALGAGSSEQGLSVDYVGKLILIVHDNDHWKLFVRPAK